MLCCGLMRSFEKEFGREEGVLIECWVGMGVIGVMEVLMVESRT